MSLNLRDQFENGNITLRVYDIDGGTKYWLQAGAALLELSGDDLTDLFTLLDAFFEES